MIDLTKDMDYVVMILITAGVGAIGGLGAELLLQRSANTGTLEMPGRIEGTRFVDLGFPASLLVGAIAAVAILYFFPPIDETVTPGTGGEPSTTTEQYDLVKLVALSLIVGSGGPAFLATAQSRVMSALNAQKAGTAIDTGKAQVEQVAESAKAVVPGAVQEAVNRLLPGQDPDVIKAVAQAASESVENRLEPQLKAAHEQIDAIGQPAQQRRG